MSALKEKKLFFLLVAFSIVGFIQLASAQSGGIYKISKSSIDAGGGVTQGGEYKISSTIGQADASTEITGGIFSLTGGYWSTLEYSEEIFDDGFE